MSMSETFSVPFHTLIKLCYTKALEWSSLVPGPKAESSFSEITNLTLFIISFSIVNKAEIDVFLREGNGTPLQYSCLENPMDGGAWKAAVHGVAEGQTRLSDFTFTFHFHALEKEMATHSSVLAGRIPGTGEPCGLPSMGSHRVGHNWCDLAAAVAANVFLELSCFFNHPTDVGNLVSGSSAFYNFSLNTCKFTDHVLLKADLEYFEHYFISVWDECNWAVIRAVFGIAFLWDWNENWLFQSCGHCWVFRICWHIHFHSIIFQDLK